VIPLSGPGLHLRGGGPGVVDRDELPEAAVPARRDGRRERDEGPRLGPGAAQAQQPAAVPLPLHAAQQADRTVVVVGVVARLPDAQLRLGAALVRRRRAALLVQAQGRVCVIAAGHQSTPSQRLRWRLPKGAA